MRSHSGVMGLQNHMKSIVHSFIQLLYCKIYVNNKTTYVTVVALASPNAYYRVSSVMLAYQCWRKEDHFRLVTSNRAMPSLYPLPSAVYIGGEAVLLPWDVSLEERDSFFGFVRSRIWVNKRVPGSKAYKLAFGCPRCKAPTPPIFTCQWMGMSWGM